MDDDIPCGRGRRERGSRVIYRCVIKLRPADAAIRTRRDGDERPSRARSERAVESHL
jgi:hypothetical protein